MNYKIFLIVTLLFGMQCVGADSVGVDGAQQDKHNKDMQCMYLYTLYGAGFGLAVSCYAGIPLSLMGYNPSRYFFIAPTFVGGVLGFLYARNPHLLDNFLNAKN